MKPKINLYDDLLSLLRGYCDPLILKSEEQKKEVEDIFFRYVTDQKFLTYFAAACSTFNEPHKTNPYNFTEYPDREEFVRDFFSDKISRGNLFRHLTNKKTEKEFKTYLHECIFNAVKTLIRYNKREKRKPEGGFKNIDDKDFGDIPVSEKKDSRAMNFENDFPLLFEELEMRSYPHLFWCSNLFNATVRNYDKVETNSDERILKWRSG